MGRKKQPLKVVIADDDDAIADYLEAVISRTAHHVVGKVSDGLQALAAIDEHDPDVIFMDLSMPTMSGLEAILVARRMGVTAKIVATSDFAIEQTVNDVLEAGADDFLAKPFSPKDATKFLN